MRFFPAMVALVGLAGGPIEAALHTQLQIAGDAPAATTNEVSVELWAMNPDGAAATLRPPQTIRLRAANASGGELALHRAQNEPDALTVAPGGFVRVRYAGLRNTSSTEWLVLESDPTGEAGTWRIALAPQAPAPAGAAEPAPATATTASAGETTNAKVEADPDASGDATDKPKRPWTTGLSANEPMYFSVGWHEGMNARFQISLKYRLRQAAEDSGPGSTPWDDFYVGYTQISVWDLESESKPFFDTSYKPSAFYYRENAASDPGSWRFGWAGGLEHESNGQGGAASRSMNIAFLRPEFTWGDDSNSWFVRFAPKLYAYLEKSENSDISEYRGYGDYRFVVGKGADGGQLSVTPRLGSTGYGSVLMDFSWPLERFVRSLNGYLHVQYFDGYGETLRTYDHDDPWQVRIGYMLVR